MGRGWQTGPQTRSDASYWGRILRRRPRRPPGRLGVTSIIAKGKFGFFASRSEMDMVLYGRFFRFLASGFLTICSVLSPFLRAAFCFDHSESFQIHPLGGHEPGDSLRLRGERLVAGLSKNSSRRCIVVSDTPEGLVV